MIEARHVDLDGFVAALPRRNLGQPEFVHAVAEVAEDIFDFTANKPEYRRWH